MKILFSTTTVGVRVVRDSQILLTDLFGENPENFDIFRIYRPQDGLESFPGPAGTFPGTFLMYQTIGGPIGSV